MKGCEAVPIVFSEEKSEWVIKDPTKEELKSIVTIGKMMVIQGLAGAYTNEKYRNFLTNTELDQFFNA